jgi:hypothetical protein
LTQLFSFIKKKEFGVTNRFVRFWGLFNSRVFTKFPQQNIELGLQVCTGTVSEQQFSELLSSSMVECLLLTPKVPGSNPETGGMWEGGRSFRVLYSESKGPTGRSQIFQMLSDSTIAYSQEPTTAPAFRGGPNMRSTWPTSQSLLLQ